MCFLQAIAIVLGFLVFVALIILLVFAVKTRSKIRQWGRDHILWEEVKIIHDGGHNSVGEWVCIHVCMLLATCISFRWGIPVTTIKLYLIKEARQKKKIHSIKSLTFFHTKNVETWWFKHCVNV